MKNQTQSIKYTLTALATALLMLSMTVFAANPVQPFIPSDRELDPDCLPTDSNCYVQSENFASTDLVLGADRIHDQNGNNLKISNGNLVYENSDNFFGLGIGGIGLGYSESSGVETSFTGVIDGGPLGRFPAMYYLYDDGAGNLIERGIYTGDVSISLNNNEITPTTSNKSSIINGGDSIVLRSQDQIVGQENSITLPNDSNSGVIFGSEIGVYSFPRADGTSNQVLQTDGSGQLSWFNAAAGT